MEYKVEWAELKIYDPNEKVGVEVSETSYGLYLRVRNHGMRKFLRSKKDFRYSCVSQLPCIHGGRGRYWVYPSVSLGLALPIVQ